MIETELEKLRAWEGRRESSTDIVGLTPARALFALLNRDPMTINHGDDLPPLFHWLYCLSLPRQSDLDTDGHLKKGGGGGGGGLLPPVPFPRRMFAGARIHFDGTLRIGDQIERTSTVKQITYKEGRRGPLYLVSVEHHIKGKREGEIIEEQDLVYVSRPTEPPQLTSPPPPAPAPDAAADWSRELTPDSRLLFRFSAVTYNTHRIHYDQDYAQNVEFYPDLVVHGPLTAVLLADFIMGNTEGRPMRAFSFRAQRPMFVNRTMTLEGRQRGSAVDARALDDSGSVAMTVEATLD